MNDTSSSFLSALQSMLGNDTPAPGPMNIVPPAAQETGGGFMDRLRSMMGGEGGTDWRNALSDVGAGLATQSWQDNPFQAFGKSVGGVDAAQAARQNALHKKMLEDQAIKDKREERQYQRGRDAVRDTQWERQFGANRSDAAHNRTLQDVANTRAGETHQMDMVKAAMDVMRAQNPQSWGAMSPDQRLKLENAVTNRLKVMQGDAGVDDPEQLPKMVDQIRRQIMAGPTAPAAPAGAPPEYTQEAPAKPMTRQEAEALPPGSWFYNPKTKSLLQKK